MAKMQYLVVPGIAFTRQSPSTVAATETWFKQFLVTFFLFH